MPSTTNSEVLLSVKNLKVHFELEHYQHHALREVFISAVSNPVEYFLKKPELLYVIDDLSFDVMRGMRLGLLGVNGSGKTTLCRCLAGMMVPQKGSIETKAQVRAIFDTGTGVMPELTGRENAFLLARLFFPEVRDLKPLVNEACEFSELGHFLDIPFRQYSKGMQARLMLSLISSQATDILILDEVLDGADYFFQQKLSVRMKKFIQAAGATIFVSHSADQVREVCEQVLVLNKGKIGFFGGVEEGIEYYHKHMAPAAT
ncbi:MAG: ABC transporter ATP-binding protein [Bdellovibrionales bacterium]|nr:ABC transporter ATP-binding protein [Bdellovibrionales bacterium]